MYDIEKIQDCLFSLIGWKNTLNTCEPVLGPALNQSSSGQFYNRTHALLRLDSLQAIAPSENDYNYPAYNGGTVYSADEIVKLDGLLYQSLVDSNQGNTPSTSPAFWQQLYPFSEWLEEQTKESINDLFNSVLVRKKINQQSKGSLADSTLFQQGRRYQTEVNKNRFVGFKLELNNYKNIRLTIDKIGLRFTDSVTDLPIYLYHTSLSEPISITNLSTTKGKDFEWSVLETPIVINYWDDLVNTGGWYYLGYYEEDLPVGISSINDQYDPIRGVCGTCPGLRRQRINWERYRPYLRAYSTAIPNGNLNIDRSLWDYGIDNVLRDKTFGLNISFKIECDITDIICKNANIFTNALIRQVQRDMANYMLNNNRTDELSNRLRKQALLELNEDGGQLELKLADEVRAISLDLSDLDTPCLPKQDFKGVRHGAV